MSAHIHLPEFGTEILFDGVSPSRRRAIEKIISDEDVHAVVILESHDRADRKLLSVGPNLEYASISEVAGLDIDGAIPVAFIDCSSFQKPRRATRIPFTRAPWGRSPATASPLQGKSAIAKPQVYGAESHLQDETTADALSHQWALLRERESEIARMEESMIARMNQHMEKEAELEQWEENLFHRERKLLEQGKVTSSAPIAKKARSR